MELKELECEDQVSDEEENESRPQIKTTVEVEVLKVEDDFVEEDANINLVSFKCSSGNHFDFADFYHTVMEEGKLENFNNLTLDMVACE